MRAVLFTAVLLLHAAAAGAQRWELQSNFWVNLHQAMLDAAQNGRPIEASLTDSEKSLWNNAVHTYRVRFYDRSPIFDEELVRINDALSAAGDLPPEGFSEEVTRALLSAAFVYRKHRWALDNRTNLFWISVAEGMLRDAGEELAQEHARVYGVPFPARTRVDVSAAAGPLGAYTTTMNGFVHTTISSRDPSYQGYAALEMLLHESSHAIVGPAAGAIGPDIQSHARARGVLAPRELWHAILFYTSGELARRALRDRGINDYTPYMYRQGMFDRALGAMRQPLETFWQSCLEGRMDRQAALAAIVDATGSQMPARVPGL
ncbi:MAG TPA: hypothetical protein VNA04_12850 [Thermoanaerobaculia bacterium]|nr:hypothetical protein [Thermoanaerobaculia bacterium]